MRLGAWLRQDDVAAYPGLAHATRALRGLLAALDKAERRRAGWREPGNVPGTRAGPARAGGSRGHAGRAARGEWLQRHAVRRCPRTASQLVD